MDTSCFSNSVTSVSIKMIGGCCVHRREQESSVELRTEEDNIHKDWFPLARFTASEVEEIPLGGCGYGGEE